MNWIRDVLPRELCHQPVRNWQRHEEMPCAMCPHPHRGRRVAGLGESCGGLMPAGSFPLQMRTLCICLRLAHTGSSKGEPGPQVDHADASMRLNWLHQSQFTSTDQQTGWWKELNPHLREDSSKSLLSLLLLWCGPPSLTAIMFFFFQCHLTTVWYWEGEHFNNKKIEM